MKAILLAKCKSSITSDSPFSPQQICYQVLQFCFSHMHPFLSIPSATPQIQKLIIKIILISWHQVFFHMALKMSFLKHTIRLVSRISKECFEVNNKTNNSPQTKHVIWSDTLSKMIDERQINTLKDAQHH